MKAGWTKRPIGELCEIVGGGTPSKSNAAFFGGDILWATVRDMRSDWIEDTEVSITAAAVKASATNILPASTVVIASRVGLGKVCRVTQDTAINQDLRGFIPKPKSQLEANYLFWWLKLVATDIVAAGRGATVQGVTLPFLRALEIPLPPLEEQRRIVAVLDEAFAGIATATSNAQKNLNNAHALFDVALEQVFFYANDDWPKRHLGDISREFGRGKSRHRPRNDQSLYGGVVPFIQTGDISRADHWLTSYSQTYNEKGLAQSRLWPKGTVCIAIVGATVGETAILDFEACFPDSVIGVVVDDGKAISEYVEYLLQAFKALLKEQGKGTARDNINLGTFEGQAFPFPDVKTQRAVVTRVSELREESRRLVLHYETKLAALAELKQSLLERAFAGKLT